MESNQEEAKPTKRLLTRALDKLRHELLEIERRCDLTTEQKIDRVVHLGCSTCAAVAIQPIPFADIFVLTPLQALMGMKIANVHGLKISDQEARESVKQLFAVMGLGLIAQQLAIGAYKTVLPFLGAITTIPLVYGLTYAIGRTIDAYFRAKAQGRSLDDATLTEIFRKARKAGEAEGRKQRAEVQAQSKGL